MFSNDFVDSVSFSKAVPLVQTFSFSVFLLEETVNKSFFFPVPSQKESKPLSGDHKNIK